MRKKKRWKCPVLHSRGEDTAQCDVSLAAELNIDRLTCSLWPSLNCPVIITCGGSVTVQWEAPASHCPQLTNQYLIFKDFKTGRWKTKRSSAFKLQQEARQPEKAKNYCKQSIPSLLKNVQHPLSQVTVERAAVQQMHSVLWEEGGQTGVSVQDFSPHGTAMTETPRRICFIHEPQVKSEVLSVQIWGP